MKTLVRLKEKEYITINFIDIIKLLYDEDYEFKMEYKCPQYSIILNGDNDNILYITNTLTDNGEDCVLSMNSDEVFRSQNIQLIINQIRIMARLIGVK